MTEWKGSIKYENTFLFFVKKQIDNAYWKRKIIKLLLQKLFLNCEKVKLEREIEKRWK